MAIPEFRIRVDREDDGDGQVGYEGHASNARFSGTVRWWGYAADLLRHAATLKGFPKGEGDAVALRLSDNCGVELACVDSTGHVQVNARLSSYLAGPDPPGQSVFLTFTCVPAQLDTFTAELQAMGNNNGTSARFLGEP